MANGVEVTEEEESEVSPVATILAEPVSSVAVSRLKEHALRSVRRADQLRHELVQRSGTELAQAQTRSSRMAVTTRSICRVSARTAGALARARMVSQRIGQERRSGDDAQAAGDDGFGDPAPRDSVRVRREGGQSFRKF